MISRRDKLLNYPWEYQRYENHKQKVLTAKAAVDVRTPTTYPHVIMNPKKVQTEKERLKQIEVENVRLLQKLGDIMHTKRIENFWTQPRPNFLNRQKLFETRPKTAITKNMSNTASGIESTGTSRRCQTCYGGPAKTIQKIPEERIPWEPPRKSWNMKETKLSDIKRCSLCCYLLK